MLKKKLITYLNLRVFSSFHTCSLTALEPKLTEVAWRARKSWSSGAEDRWTFSETHRALRSFLIAHRELSLENSTKLLARISVRLYIAWWQTPGSNPSPTITDWFWIGNVAVNPACHGFKTGQWASQRLVSWDLTRLSRHDLILKQACSSERVIWNAVSSLAHVSENKQRATLRRKMH